MRCPWGQKAFSGYLGADQKTWEEYDASVLVARRRDPRPILIDQGAADKFLPEQLYPEVFADHARRANTHVTLRMHPGYDHGYYFISTFMEDHIRHHAPQLKARS
jgi:S-formylglutathione hydrolase